MLGSSGKRWKRSAMNRDARSRGKRSHERTRAATRPVSQVRLHAWRAGTSVHAYAFLDNYQTVFEAFCDRPVRPTP